MEMRKHSWQICVLLLAMALLAGALACGLLRYEIWGQIDYLSRANFDFSSQGMIAHAPRYFVVSPSYLIAALFDLEPDVVFGWYVYFLVFATAILWLAIRINISDSRSTGYFGFLVPCILAVAINGRFAFGLFGLSTICLALIRMRLIGIRGRFILAILAGLLFSSVSSGIFTVGLLFTALTAVDFWRANSEFKLSPFKKRVLLIISAVLSVPLCGLLLVFLVKNVSYYGDGIGGAVNMLSHGLGLLVNPYPLVEYCHSEGDSGVLCAAGEELADSVFVLIMTALIVTLTVIEVLFWLRHTNLNKLARRGVALSLLGGMFGLTTLLSILFVLPAWVDRRNVKATFSGTSGSSIGKVEGAA